MNDNKNHFDFKDLMAVGMWCATRQEDNEK